MNRTEQAYAEHLEAKRIAGEVAWWKFEGVKLRLADGCFLTMDFAVMQPNGIFELHDTKGSLAIWTDDAKVKVKCAAEMYPFRFVIAVPIPRKQGGGWELHEV
jgi:hypothetical protein